MKIIFLILSLLLFDMIATSQEHPRTDSTSRLTIADSTNDIHDATKTDKQKSYDTLKRHPFLNTYGDLLDDDREYNRRYAVWKPAARVVLADGFNWAVARYVFNFDWARISARTWKNNLKSGWEWDNDHFGTNFIGHPHSGNVYFNIARSNGYSFWQSLPFAIQGSLIWEYFGENTAPSKNDIINTPLSGMFLGEILYRVSSNILDDRSRGSERVFREIFAGLVNPPRALNRLTQKKMFRVTPKEVYQKEPLNITLWGGIHKINNNNKFGTGETNYILNLQLDYGDPFEVRHRKPFDVFRFRTESSLGRGRLLGSAVGYALLFGKNIIKGDHGVLVGGFQYFDYWNNKVFELGSLGYGLGVISRIPIRLNSSIYSSFHFAAVPLAGNNTSFGPDTSLFRDYNFGGGLEAKIEETFHVNKFVSLGFTGYYYWISNYEHLPGYSLVGILRPRITVKLFGNTGIGVEHHVYYINRFLNKFPSLHLTRTEQKFFLQIFLEDSKRKGKYH